MGSAVRDRVQRLTWKVHDTVRILLGGAVAGFSAFTDTQIGGVKKTDQQSNMMEARRIVGNMPYKLHGFQIYIPMLANDNTGNTVRDFEELGRAFLEVKIEKAVYYECLLRDIPAGQGTYIQSDAAAAALIGNCNGMPLRANVFLFEEPIDVIENEGLELKGTWNAPCTVHATLDMVITAITTVDRPPR